MKQFHRNLRISLKNVISVEIILNKLKLKLIMLIETQTWNDLHLKLNFYLKSIISQDETKMKRIVNERYRIRVKTLLHVSVKMTIASLLRYR